MIDYEAIGQRIIEERKHFRKISQEKMAEDLGMYQADISNIEKAKRGSGITDLSKLDLIADYFEVPLERLLFGRNKEEEMVKYYSKKLEIKDNSKVKKPTKEHAQVLKVLMGMDVTNYGFFIFECGPYITYAAIEHQIEFSGGTKIEAGNIKNGGFTLSKLHTYTFYKNECIAAMVVSLANLMQLIFQPSFIKLQTFIQPDVLDVLDAWRTLNPYVPFLMFSDNDEDREGYQKKVLQRMDELKKHSESMVLFIESIYVGSDYRQLGICRMLMDILDLMFGDSTIWLNMEPTCGEELNSEYSFYPTYTLSEVGQISLNASIAEKLGFRVDPDAWHREAETVDAEGNVSTEVIEVRKCAYKIAKCIQPVIANDGDLVAMGRARQKLALSGHEPGEIVYV